MSDSSITLTAFLLDRIVEDEAWAGDEEFPSDPARLLAECDAKRRIVALHVPDRHLENWYWPRRKCAECGGLWHVITPFAKPTDIGPEQGCMTIRLLALPYADHPDYRGEWRV